MNELELKKRRLSTGVKWGLGLAAALIISPVIFMIVKGLVGLAIAGVVGLAIINFAPVLSMKFANWKLKGIKAEAARNPVETMQHVYMEKESSLAAFLDGIEEFATEVNNFEDELATFKRQFPNEAPKFDKTFDAMQTLLKRRRQRYSEAKNALYQFSAEINKADAIWKMGLAAQKLTKAAGQTDDDFMQRIKTETAIDSVQSSLNRAMAELETSLLEETPAIGYSSADVIELPVPAKKVAT